MLTYGAIDSKKMPAPDAKVNYAKGMFGPAMFHYLPEYADPRETAKEHGFEMKAILMADSLDESSPLFDLYFEKGEVEQVFTVWRPKAPDDSWKLAGCHDTDDGAVAIFLRPTKSAEDAPTVVGESGGTAT